MKDQCLLSILLAAGAASAQAQSVKFLYVPPPGSYDHALFKVTEVDVTKYGVTALIYVFGSYWTKPYWATPVMPINPDGTGSIDLTTGGQDACAQSIHLFIVPLDAQFTLGSGQASIPADLEALAIARVSATKGVEDSVLSVFGLDWTIKDTGTCVWGPGPNSFSKNMVSVDAEGKLHLKIAYVEGVWRCAEIISKRSFGYGTYAFTVDTDLMNKLPESPVFGIFTYSDDAEYTHREIDYEFSKGVVVGLPEPHQYVIQPYTFGDHRHKFELNGFPLSHSITWQPDFVYFATYKGFPKFIGASLTYSLESAGDVQFGSLFNPNTSWVAVDYGSNAVVSDVSFRPNMMFYRSKLSSYQPKTDIAPDRYDDMYESVPVPGGEKIHINFWLFQGTEPGPQSASYEVVVSKLTFEPMDPSTLSPRLEMISVTTNKVDIKVSVP